MPELNRDEFPPKDMPPIRIKDNLTKYLMQQLGIIQGEPVVLTKEEELRLHKIRETRLNKETDV